MHHQNATYRAGLSPYQDYLSRKYGLLSNTGLSNEYVKLNTDTMYIINKLINTDRTLGEQNSL